MASTFPGTCSARVRESLGSDTGVVTGRPREVWRPARIDTDARRPADATPPSAVPPTEAADTNSGESTNELPAVSLRRATRGHARPSSVSRTGLRQHHRPASRTRNQSNESVPLSQSVPLDAGRFVVRQFATKPSAFLAQELVPPGDTRGDTTVSERWGSSRARAKLPGVHADLFRVSLPRTKVPISRHFACRRRDSNPRHADYDSAALWLYGWV